MANPKRETKRERRDEAKRRRLEELRRRQRKERIRKLGMLGGVAAAVVAIILLVTLLGGGGDVNTPESIRLATAAGCERISSPAITESSHINPPERTQFSTNPPTSGKHYNAAGLGPVTTGIHRAAVQYEGSTHNLEHGHVVIHYKESAGPAIAGVLAEVTRSDPRWILMAPNPDMPFQVAFTAWGKLQGCNTPIAAGLAAAAEDFIDRFKDKAPESGAGTPEAGTDTATPPASASPTASPSTPSSPAPTGSPT